MGEVDPAVNWQHPAGDKEDQVELLKILEFVKILLVPEEAWNLVKNHQYLPFLLL